MRQHLLLLQRHADLVAARSCVLGDSPTHLSGVSSRGSCKGWRVFAEGGEGLRGGEATRYHSSAGQELMLSRQILEVGFI